MTRKFNLKEIKVNFKEEPCCQYSDFSSFTTEIENFACLLKSEAFGPGLTALPCDRAATPAFNTTDVQRLKSTLC